MTEILTRVRRQAWRRRSQRAFYGIWYLLVWLVLIGLLAGLGTWVHQSSLPGWAKIALDVLLFLLATAAAFPLFKDPPES